MIATWKRIAAQGWVWSFLAAALVWLATITYTGGQGAGEILTAALSFATFSIIVGALRALVSYGEQKR
jgi:ribose transport system permease protein